MDILSLNARTMHDFLARWADQSLENAKMVAEERLLVDAAEDAAEAEEREKASGSIRGGKATS